jgi:serpin B
MGRAFSDEADFSGISNLSEMPELLENGEVGLKISEVIHKAFVEVTEEGTEAAAATAIIMEATITSVQPVYQPILFKADHPFMFMILHKESGSILFMGDLASPNN